MDGYNHDYTTISIDREVDARLDAAYRSDHPGESAAALITNSRDRHPVAMTDILRTIDGCTGSWPRRVDDLLFVDDAEHGIAYLDRPAALFGWLQRHHSVWWAKGAGLASHGEVYAELQRTAKRYDAIEVLPHEPPMAGIYYRGTAPEPGDGDHLRRLLDRFRPATTIDRDLIQAAMMTMLWGGPPGSRPVFVITSDDGRGTGKSTLANVISYGFGGAIDVSTGEDIGTLKSRLLSPEARTRRMAVLDNVKTLRFSWAELEALVTSPIISGRQLYVGEGRRPNLLTWFVTLNGVSLATDMAQRAVVIKLAKGQHSATWLEETLRFVDEHRQDLIADVIGALRSEPFELGQYTRWATWERDILSRLPEPGEAQRVILERQGEANCEEDEAEIIEDYFAERLLRLNYTPATAQVRIPAAIVAEWYGQAVGERCKTAAATRRLRQMAMEGQVTRISPDPCRTYGRGFIWTGEEADVQGGHISNDLPTRLEHHEGKGRLGHF